MRLFPILLAGCADKATDSAVTDSGTDTTASAHTITGTVVAPEDTTLPAAVTVGVVHLQFGEGPDVQGTLVSATVAADGTFSLPLPEEPIDITYELVETKNIVGATHFVVAFEDTNGNGSFSEGEPLLGAPLQHMVVYFEDTKDLASYGWSPGWHMVDSGMAGSHEANKCRLDTDSPLLWRDYDGYPTVSEVSTTAVEIPLRGLPATLTMSGTSVDFERLGIFAYQEVNNDDDIDPFADVALTDTFSLTLTDAPPEAAYITGDPDWNYALGIPQPYTDTDGSGDYSDDDDREGTTTCYDGEDAVARYTKPVTAWRGWRLMECYEANAGWRLVTQADDGGWRAFQSSQAATELHLEHGECHW